MASITVRSRSARLRTLLAAPALLVTFAACSLSAGLPTPDSTPTPCSGNCPPPQLSNGQAHSISTSLYTLTYFDPWSASKSGNSVTLEAGTDFGNVTVLVRGVSVANGTTAQQLLTSTANSQLDPNQFSGLQDDGPILGAEVGYISGAGESYDGYSANANSPNTPIYIEIMASVRGTTGLTFTAVSPLDPNSPDVSVVPNEDYDHIVNSIQWK
jgi:hypothetical protein